VLVSAVFEHEVSVRWRDVDGLGHVNHAVFLTYLEEGRDAFYAQALGRDPHYVVARVEIDMRAEVLYADRHLQVRIKVERVGTTSLTTREMIVTPAGVTAAERGSSPCSGTPTPASRWRSRRTSGHGWPCTDTGQQAAWRPRIPPGTAQPGRPGPTQVPAISRAATRPREAAVPGRCLRMAARLARDHARLRAAIGRLARVANGDQPLPADQLAVAIGDFVSQSERHLNKEMVWLANGRASRSVSATTLRARPGSLQAAPDRAWVTRPCACTTRAPGVNRGQGRVAPSHI